MNVSRKRLVLLRCMHGYSLASAIIVAFCIGSAFCHSVVFHEDFENVQPGPFAGPPQIGEAVEVFIPQHAHLIEVVGDNAYSGARALRITADVEESTPLVLLADRENSRPLTGTTYRISFNYLAPAPQTGASIRVNFGSGRHPAGIRMNPLTQRFQYWTEEGEGSWNDTGIAIPPGEWLTVEMTLRIFEVEGELSGAYNVRFHTELQGETELVADVPLGLVDYGMLRLFAANDRPLPGNPPAETYWDNIEITLAQE